MAAFDKITCPYCSAEFSHKQVHFRMETVFDESELNDEGMTMSELEKLPDTSRKEALIAQTRLRGLFLRKDDEKYMGFWQDFESGTTEQTLGIDKKLPCPVYQLPILNPGDKRDQTVLKKQEHQQGSDYFIYDGDGMVTAVMDAFEKKTHRRVCPYCHNPLPMQYGKYPTKFISIIGMTGAGKTIYISQLLKHMSRYMAYVGMASYFTSNHEPDFIEANPVQMGKPLPNSTGKGTFSQPMFYDLQTTELGRAVTNTVVLYDIAGEDCETITDMARYGEYINHSDGIILLIRPDQLGWASVKDDKEENVAPETVLNTIHGAMTQLGKTLNGKFSVPVAVCVSQSDRFEDMFSDPEIGNDITPDKEGGFNARAYNNIEMVLRENLGHTPLHTALKNGYEHFNYFAFSAVGGPVRASGTDGNGDAIDVPVGPPVPKRIAEPLLWMLYQFGYIRANEKVRLPEHRIWPEWIEVPATGLFGKLKKPGKRPLTDEEKEAYWYEE